jgi:gas vesicle protein
MLNAEQKKRLKKVLRNHSTKADSLEQLEDDFEKKLSSALSPLKENLERVNIDSSELEKSLISKIELVSSRARQIADELGVKSEQRSASIEKLLTDEIKSVSKYLKTLFTENTDEINKKLKEVEKRIEDLYWLRSLNGSNNVQAVLNIKSGGVTVANNVVGLNFTGATVTSNPDGTVTVAVTGGSTNFTDSEVVFGSGTSFTLAFTPILGSVHLYARGQRLTPVTDYSITGTAITTVRTWLTGDLLADYRT